jgi:hypothetical protein
MLAEVRAMTKAVGYIGHYIRQSVRYRGGRRV